MKLIKRKNRSGRNSCVEFFIKGYNIERALNFLSNKGVEFFEVEKYDIKSARIQFKVKYRKIVKKYLKEHKFTIEKEKFLGFAYIFNFFKMRWGFGAGAFVVIAFFIVMNNFCLQLNIFGVDDGLKSEIVALLESNGVSAMSDIDGISTEEVEKIILDNFENVSMVSAVKKGNSILINIKEKLNNEDYEGLTKLSPLLATQNGLITEINLIQGTLLVKAGDVVRVGDPLVAPYTLDASGKRIPIIPKAEVVADIWVTGMSEHKEVEAKTTRTGNFVSFRESSFLGKTIFSNMGEAPFDNYEIEVKSSYLAEYIFPILYKEIFYFETKCDIIEIAFEEIRDEKIEEAKKQAYMQVLDASKIKAEDCSISLNNDKWVVVYTITLSGNIAV